MLVRAHINLFLYVILTVQMFQRFLVGMSDNVTIHACIDNSISK